MKEVSITELL